MKRRMLVLCVMLILTLAACGYSADGVPYRTAAPLEAGQFLDSLSGIIEPETEAPPEPEEQRVSFLAAGDAIVHTGIWLEARKNAQNAGGDREYDFSHLFARTAETIVSYDLAFINQETLMAGKEYGYSSYPRFNTPRELADDLIDAGFDIVNIANNHMMDMLPEGLAATIDFWNTKPVTLLGGYKNATDYNTPHILERNGIRIAFLSYCYGTNGLSMPEGYDMVIPYLDETIIRHQTALAREQADFVVVSVHWGEDSVQAVTEQQQTFAKLFADCGVDVVVGHHPHLIQPIEWIEGEDGNRMLCAYSLGNLFSLMADAENMVGGFLTLDFVKTGGDCHVDSVTFLPTIFYYNTGFFGQSIYFMEDYSEDLAAAHGVQTYGAGHNQTYAALLSYTKDLIDAEFLPEVLGGNAP